MTLELDNISISPDDPCVGLWELNEPSGLDTLLPKGGLRRRQTLMIMRMGWDVPRVFSFDIGRASNFHTTEFFAPGGILHLKDGTDIMVPKIMPPFESIRKIEVLHKFGELQEYADDARGGAIEAPEREPMDIWTEFLNQKEQQTLYKKQNTRTLSQIVNDILYKRREGWI